MAMCKYLAALVLILALVHSGSSLKCYQCSELHDSGCKDPFGSKAPSVECSGSQVCVKHKTPAQLSESAYLTRGCMTQNYCQQVQNHSEFCSSCNLDLCNSSTIAVPSFALIALVVIRNYLL